MTLLAASLLALQLLPAAALKPPPVPTPGPADSASPPSKVGVPRLPISQRKRYELFTQKCGRCHTPDRALEADFGAAQWEDYLRKKYRRAGAGISPEQSEEIGAFLRYWSGRKK